MSTAVDRAIETWRLNAQDPEKLSSSEVMAATGVSYRRLDYWARTGRIHAINEGHGSGLSNQRWFTPDEVEVIGYALTLIGAGFEVDPALLAARQLVEHRQPVRLAGGLIVIWPVAP